jgi:hypothetical protein
MVTGSDRLLFPVGRPDLSPDFRTAVPGLIPGQCGPEARIEARGSEGVIPARVSPLLAGTKHVSSGYFTPSSDLPRLLSLPS